MLFCPESPPYLVSKNKIESARNSLQFLRGHDNIETELTEIQSSIEEAANKNFHIRQLKNSSNKKPLVIAIMLMFGQQFSGINAVIYFSVSIFEACHTSLDSFVENIILSSVLVVATGIATVIMDKLGRRILLVTSALVMIVALYGLGLYFYILKNHSLLAAKISFLPLFSVGTFVFFFSVGFGPIPWLMMSELFSPEAKGISTSISSATNWFLAFVVTQFFVPMKNVIGTAATFWMFASINLFIMTYCLYFVPETKGKTLEDIQNYFREPLEQDGEPILDNDSLARHFEEEINAEIDTTRTRNNE